MMKNKIVILKEGKKIFSLKNGPPKKPSKKGDVDIMIESRMGNNPLYFSNVVAGNYFRHYKLPEHEINAISWNGYYEEIDESRLYTPIVHIKSGHNKIDKIWHFGSINDKEPFAFPVCSLFIPEDLNVNSFEPSEPDKGWHCKKLDLKTNVRIDFFVLPKNIPARKLMDSPISKNLFGRYFLSKSELFPVKNYILIYVAMYSYS